MKEKQVKLPDPDHPISIQRNPARVVVSVAGHVIADTRNALTLREADYPAVQYIPREDVRSYSVGTDGPRDLLPVQRRLHLLQRSRWKKEVGQRGVDVRESVSRCCADQRTSVARKMEADMIGKAFASRLAPAIARAEA
jgi:hypothetical protein